MDVSLAKDCPNSSPAIPGNRQGLRYMETVGEPQPGQDRYPPSDIAERKNLDDTPNFREVIGTFWARKWLITACIIVCSVLAFVTAMLIYTGVALVVIKPMRAGEPATTASVMAA